MMGSYTDFRVHSSRVRFEPSLPMPTRHYTAVTCALRDESGSTPRRLAAARKRVAIVQDQNQDCDRDLDLDIGRWI